MDQHKINEIKRAIEVASGTDAYYHRSRPCDSTHQRKGDYIVRVMCSECGVTLGGFEVRNSLAFCFRCRQLLFPQGIDCLLGFR